MRTRKLLLLLTADRLRAWHWNKGVLSAPQSYTGTPEDRARFITFLKQERDPVYLMVDLMDEDFHFESLPHLNDIDHRSLIQQRLEHFYPGAPFRLAIRQRQALGSSHDDEMLYSTLSHPARLTPWLNAIRELKVPLAGIYSVPQLCAGLLPELPSDHVLLFTWEEHAGLRASYFHARRLRFSRLIPTDDLTRTAFTEQLRIRQYLHSQHLLPLGPPLDVICLFHIDDHPALQEILARDHTINCQCLDLTQRARALGVTNATPSSDATPVLLHLLATRTPMQHYATDEHTEHFRLRRFRRILFGLSALSLSASVAWSASNFAHLRELDADNAATGNQISQLSQQALSLSQNMPSLPTSLAEIKSAIAQLGALDKHSPPPQKTLAGLATTLDAFPDIRVAKLAWQADLPPAQESQPPVQTLLLYGKVEDEAADYRAKLDYQQNFRRALIAHGYRVAEFQPGSPQNGDSSPFVLQLTWTSEP
ncbi:MAG: hypothetical protein HY849_06930 [Nitrosomonadales bacterium]|nr:hypothetical protein [Nitrosomonadales bacterium]